MRRLARLLVVGLVPLAAAVNHGVRANASAAAVLTGDPQGVQLAHSVDAAYRNVPGLVRRGTLVEPGGLRERTVSIVAMRQGIIAAQDFKELSLPPGEVYEYMTTASGFFERRPFAQCWTRSPLGADASVGTTAVMSDGDNVAPPQVSKAGVLMTVRHPSGSTTVFLIDRTSRRVIWERGSGPSGDTSVIRYTALTVPPQIREPSNIC